MGSQAHFQSKSRSSIGNPDHPVVNQPDPPSIEDLHHVFMNEGVPLAVSAARRAIEEAGVNLEQIVSLHASLITFGLIVNPQAWCLMAQDLARCV